MNTSSTQPSTTQKVLDLYRDAIRSGVSLEEVQAEITEFNELVQEVHTLKKRDKRLRTPFWRVRRTMPFVLITLGSVLIANAAWPILYYTLFVSPSLQRNTLSSPVPDSKILTTSEGDKESMLIQPVSADSQLANPRVKPVILDEQLDYANLANWFSDTNKIQDIASQTVEKSYFVSIPSLDIEEARVKMGGTDLNRSLIQYPGTADPGEFGAPVIFGHSVLRQFYRPQLTNPNRYKSIFSKIMTMELGEEIFIDYEGVKYTYVVTEKTEVQPEDTYILEQRHTSRELKLITCVPEGTYLRRGVIVAQLKKVE